MRQGRTARRLLLLESRAGMLSVFVAGTLLGLATWHTPAVAQGRDAESTVRGDAAGTAICLVEANEALGPTQGGAKPVMASCRGRGLMLGQADAFEVITNEALEAVLVDMRRGTDRHILLISLQGAGDPLLEDLGGQISMAAGRGPLSTLEGIEIDLADFASGGTIAVLGPAGEGEEADVIDVGRQLVQLRAHDSGDSAEN